VLQAVPVTDDILTRGADREPGRWPGRLAAIAVLVVLAVVIAAHIPHGRTAQGPPPSVAVTAGPVQLAGLGSSAAALLDRGGWVTGPGLPWAGSFRIMIIGQYPGLEPATSRPARSGGLNRPGSGYLLIRYMRVGGGSTVQLIKR
jgi:hypothetical protein